MGAPYSIVGSCQLPTPCSNRVLPRWTFPPPPPEGPPQRWPPAPEGPLLHALPRRLALLTRRRVEQESKLPASLRGSAWSRGPSGADGHRCGGPSGGDGGTVQRGSARLLHGMGSWQLPTIE
jgi:hypothetical protein